jgi:hypothetical protein
MRLNVRTGELRGPDGVIARRVVWATKFRERRRGVRGREALTRDEALVISPCRQVHTYSVPYPLDAVFCDRELRVLHVETLEPRNTSARVRRARCCVELVGGRAAECGLMPGVRLSFVSTER